MPDEHGRVAAYDGRRGLGTLEHADGQRIGFHCTAIADESRDIPVGATVAFQLVPRHLGVWEATAVRST